MFECYTEEKYYFSDAAEAVLNLLRAEKKAVALMGSDGKVKWATDEMYRLVDIESFSTLPDALSDTAGTALRYAQKHCAVLDCSEVAETVRYEHVPCTMHARPFDGGMLVLMEPVSAEPESSVPDELERSEINSAVVGMIAAVAGTEYMPRVQQQSRRVWRAQLHRDILMGRHLSDFEGAEQCDVVSVCRTLDQASTMQGGLPITVEAEEPVMRTAVNLRALRCVLLNLACNAAVNASYVTVRIERIEEQLCIHVESDRVNADLAEADLLLNGWRKQIRSMDPHLLGRFGTGLPVVRRLLDLMGGTLLLQRQDDRLSVSVMLPIEQPEGTKILKNPLVERGVDIIDTELSVMPMRKDK